MGPAMDRASLLEQLRELGEATLTCDSDPMLDLFVYVSAGVIVNGSFVSDRMREARIGQIVQSQHQTASERSWTPWTSGCEMSS